MKSFNELIKNFDKIREYLRIFSVYGYKQREDFEHKSPRTYDNEKRRIQSFLNSYISEQTSSKGKSLSINFDYMTITANPLYEGFKTRSFTKNDIMLHFILLDLLSIHEKLTFNTICELLLSYYLDVFDDYRIIDPRTIRIKINEYINYGLISEKKCGNKRYYFLSYNLFNDLSQNTVDKLMTAISFFQNISILGMVGNFILERIENKNAFFSYRNFHFSNTIDDIILYDLLSAIKGHNLIKLYNKKTNYIIVLPLKIVNNVEQGRNYTVVYHSNSKEYKIYRIDKINKIEILETSVDRFEQKLNIANALLDSTWGVTLSNTNIIKQLETWELLLHIKEDIEKDLLKKIKCAHQEARFHRVNTDTFHYTISVLDANEVIPWFRQFIGRILYIDCTNKFALKRFIDDIQLMKVLYE